VSDDGGAIRLDAVSLRYRLAKQRIPSLKEYVVHWARGFLVYEEFWALRDVSLRVSRGEHVGIVGGNGAGKSTLLKVISGVVSPARGTVRVQGSVVPILELGTGFDQELTGLENIYLNALLLGRSKAEIAARVDAIAATSGLGDFVRSPIRNYSSGMLARLGFSIATAWVPDILILDEVLAVGDAAFRQHCLQRLREFEAARTTLLLVSHDPDAILQSCERCLWIKGGRIEADGPSKDVLAAYLAFSQQDAAKPATA
jgi:ABC-2 type transport system ATP-binding protein/lipopolysaccharide transport system ATP-binding protein